MMRMAKKYHRADRKFSVSTSSLLFYSEQKFGSHSFIHFFVPTNLHFQRNNASFCYIFPTQIIPTRLVFPAGACNSRLSQKILMLKLLKMLRSHKVCRSPQANISRYKIWQLRWKICGKKKRIKCWSNRIPKFIARCVG